MTLKKSWKVLEFDFAVSVATLSFANNRKNFTQKLSLNVTMERYYSFLDHCLLFCHYLMFQKKFFCELKWGHKHSLGEKAPLPLS